MMSCERFLPKDWNLSERSYLSKQKQLEHVNVKHSSVQFFEWN